MDRRSFMRLSGYAATAAIAARYQPVRAQQGEQHTHSDHASSLRPAATLENLPRATPAARTRVIAPGGQRAVVTPNGRTLPLRVVRGMKVGHLIAGQVEHGFTPGLSATCWGYNGGTPGPTIEAVEGDRVRLYVTNRLPEPTSVHWHGMIVPNGMDGVSGLTQAPIGVDQTFVYEFTLKHAGTFLYHSHFDEMTQIALGLVGMFVVHPKQPTEPAVDRDFALLTHEWRLDVGAKRPNPNEMTDWNVFTFNGKSFPATQPLLIQTGERVRIRLGNLSPMDHHPIHVHGLTFNVAATDGGFIPKAAQHPETTVLVPVGTTRVIEFVPHLPGDWAVHCHMTHHVMTQMGHDFPNMLGAHTGTLDKRMAQVLPSYMSMGTTGMGDMMEMPIPPNSRPMRSSPGPFGPIDMGGMFTLLKVRDDVRGGDVDGWYRGPERETARLATPEQLAADGIEIS